MSRTSRKWWARGLYFSLLVLFISGFIQAYLETQTVKEMNRAHIEKWQAIYGLLDSATIGFAVLDQEGLVREWNPALVRWTGYSVEEMIGENITILMDGEDDRLHDFEYTRAIRNPSADSHAKVINCKMLTKAGNKVPVKINVVIVDSPSGDENPYAVALIFKSEDVVEIDVDGEGVSTKR